MAKSVRHLVAIGLGALALSSCTAEDFNVYDTGSMDADRFAQQTYPVWDRPAVVVPVDRTPVYKRESTILDYSENAGYPSAQPASALARYASMEDEGHRLPSIPAHQVDPGYLRQEIAYRTTEAAGTIVVDTTSRHLYYVLGNGRAIRYGVGIGRAGYAWKGAGIIRYKRTWPRWTPSEQYVAEKPQMKMFSASYGGLVGGTNNPLGARALYIYANGHDTLFRVHGTPDWKSVGKQVSSGCIRMFNQDVIDLYSRVRDGSRIVVL